MRGSLMKRSVGNAVVRGGMLSMARLLTGVVRVKVLALALGAGGVGVYAILLQLYLTGVAAVSMSLAVPIINLGRPNVAAGQFDEAGCIAGTALALVGANILILLPLSAAFGQALLGQLGVEREAGGLVWPIAAAVSVGAVSGAFWEGLSFLTGRFDIYVRAGIIGAIGDMLLVAGGAALYGLHGAILGMAAGTIVMFTAYALLIGRDPTARRVIRNLSAKVAQLPQLFTYSALMFATVAATNAGLIYLRSRVLIEAGATANGYLQAVTSLAAYLLTFVMTGFWGHLHPLAAARGDTVEVRRELSRSLGLGMLISFTGCGVAMVTAPFIIPLFYSHQFKEAAGLLVAYLPGELCFQLFSMLVAHQLTVSLRRAYLGLNLGYVALLVLAGTLLIPDLGGGGYVAAHVAASFVMVVVAMLFAAAKGQIDGRLVGKATVMIVILTAIAALVFYGRQTDHSELAQAPLLLPFAISGVLVLLRLWQDWRHPLVPATERNSSISRGAWESSE